MQNNLVATVQTFWRDVLALIFDAANCVDKFTGKGAKGLTA